MLIGAAIVAIAIPKSMFALLRVARCGTTSGLAPAAVLLDAYSFTWWLAYGIIRRDLIQIINNGLFLFVLAGICAYMMREHRVHRVLVWTVFVATALGIFVSTALDAVNLIVGIAIITGIFCELPQCWECWKRPGGVAISICSRLLLIFSAGIWVAYGIFVHDVFLWASSLLACLQNTFIVARTIQGRAVLARGRTELFSDKTKADASGRVAPEHLAA